MSGNEHLLFPDPPVDLTNCDLEPIHIPSLIQPPGMLLAARSPIQSGDDSHSLYTSGNSQAILGIAPADIFGRTLPELLGREAVIAIETALGDQQGGLRQHVGLPLSHLRGEALRRFRTPRP